MTWITARQVASLLGISPNSVHWFCHQRQITSRKINGGRDIGQGKHYRVYDAGEILKIKRSGYTVKDAKRRAGKLAIAGDHPWKQALSPNARQTLTPHQAVMARLKAKRNIENGVQVREVPEIDLSIFEGVS